MSNFLTTNSIGTSISAFHVKVSDEINSVAAECDIDLAATGVFAPPPIEYAIPGDTETLTGLTLRPNGTIITVSAGYSSIPIHAMFTGVITYMDDVNDANKDIWAIKMAAMPRNQPQRVPITYIANFDLTKPTIDSSSSVGILAAICKAAGVQIGRNDLPNYAVVGTYESIHRTAVQAAQALVSPFNLFEFLHYYVRMDTGGMNILKVDYAAAPGGGVYEIPNVISVETSYELYAPDARLGDTNVLLTGGDILTFESQEVSTITVTETFTTSTQDSSATTNLNKWAEKTTTIQFVCQVTGGSFSGITDLGTLINAFINGQIQGLQILSSYTLSDQTDEYDSQNGLTQTSISTYTYTEKTFSANTYMSFSVTKKVLDFDETVVTIYPGGQAFPKSMVRRTHNYNQIGVETSTVNVSYMGVRGQWVLNDTNISQGDLVGATNAEIQFYSAKRASFSSASPLQSGVFPATSTTAITKTQIGKYQLLNGTPLPILGQDILASANAFGGVNGEFALLGFEEKTAFQVSGPNMDYNGLELLWQLCLQERALEQANCYWQITKVKASLDTTPAVGSSAKANGMYGWVTSIQSDIDANEAITEITLKRLVPGGIA